MTDGTPYLIAGNWKMHGSRREAARLAAAVAERKRAAGGGPCDVLLCPPAVLIPLVVDAVAGTGVAVGGQDCHAEPAGAHTGDISAEMLADAGCSHVIVGHSERRAAHHEADDAVRAKAAAARRAGLVPIVCIGETEEQRDAGRALEVVRGQLARSLPERIDRPAAVIVAYEPVWAIGTGRTPTPDQIAEVHGFIRRQLGGKTDDPAAVRLLYGGSTKADNAPTILAIPDVDGALVGGASLDADEFRRICESRPDRR